MLPASLAALALVGSQPLPAELPQGLAGQHGLAMDGVSRLNKDWAPGETLRADLADHHNLRLHVWHGVQGVTLHYFAFPAPAWAAYAATRPKGDPLPRRRQPALGGRIECRLAARAAEPHRPAGMDAAVLRGLRIVGQLDGSVNWADLLDERFLPERLRMKK